jgi:hypothetical protein
MCSESGAAGEKLDLNQAYAAMYYFLETQHSRVPSDELAIMLGSMALLKDGRPADEGAWSDWLEAVERARTDEAGIEFRLSCPTADSGRA